MRKPSNTIIVCIDNDVTWFLCVIRIQTDVLVRINLVGKSTLVLMLIHHRYLGHYGGLLTVPTLRPKCG